EEGEESPASLMGDRQVEDQPRAVVDVVFMGSSCLVEPQHCLYDEAAHAVSDEMQVLVAAELLDQQISEIAGLDLDVAFLPKERAVAELERGHAQGFGDDRGPCVPGLGGAADAVNEDDEMVGE